MSILGILYLVITFFVVLFQLGLVFGFPWGNFTMGGKYTGKLPAKFRFIAIFQIFILIFFAIIISIKSGLMFTDFQNLGNIGIWIIIIFFVFGSIFNFITPSKKERMLWFPVNLIMLLISLLIALN